ncbi:MAG TPA: hypothetical protein VIG74_04155 [Alphaproteobacteria bacterium]|jgi:hypothetical protein
MFRNPARSPFFNKYTWQIEAAVVGVSLLAVIALSGGRWVEYIGAAAVFFTFMHAQVTDRMAEQQAVLPQPTVQCWRWAQRYFFIKEVLWLVYFMLLHAWSALLGVGLFLLYPAWRKYYKASNPEIYGDASKRAA